MLSDNAPYRDDDHRAIALIELLGTGRHGSVFRATQGPARELVAVKIPLDDAAADEEARALRRFSHPNVVALLDGPLDNGALVLEPCTSTLADRPGTDTSARDELATIGRGVLDALDHMHGLGWIHGDVTPANIGLRADGTVALLDFATARPFGDDPVTEGTPEFLGALRLASPPLDLRAAAACLRASICPTRWSSDGADLADGLDAFIARADAGRPVNSDELRVLLDLPKASGEPHALDASVASTVPPLRAVSRTTSFGPRPERPPRAAVRARLRPRRSLVVALLGLAVVLASMEFWGSSAPTSPTPGTAPIVSIDLPGPSTTTPALSGAQRVISAAASLRAHDATWDAGTARLTIADAGRVRHIDVGRAGDQLAIADWDCSGDATLGLYRPSTGAWYVFDSWVSAAAAGPRVDLAPGGDLAFVVDAEGCATPRV